MKSKIDLSERDSCEVVISLLELLGYLQIDAADELHSDTLEEYHCGYCERHHERCSCGDDDSRRRYDEYDDEAGYED